QIFNRTNRGGACEIAGGASPRSGPPTCALMSTRAHAGVRLNVGGSPAACHGNLAAEIVRSGARRRWHLAHPRLALPRADRPVALPHQAVRLVFSLGLWRSLGGLRLGSRERHRLGTSLNHLLRRLTISNQLPQRSKRGVELLVGHRLDAVGVLDLHLLGDY